MQSKKWKLLWTVRIGSDFSDTVRASDFGRDAFARVWVDSLTNNEKIPRIERVLLYAFVAADNKLLATFGFEECKQLSTFVEQSIGRFNVIKGSFAFWSVVAGSRRRKVDRKRGVPIDGDKGAR
jgi:hypothetical protein